MKQDGLFSGIINEISYIRLTDKHFNYETMEANANIWVTELFPDKIRVYRKIKGQKEKLFKDEVNVQCEEMKVFFNQIYDFVRTAEYSGILIDDADHEIVIRYNTFHKEIILNNLYRGKDSLLRMISEFVDSKGVATFEESMGSSKEI